MKRLAIPLALLAQPVPSHCSRNQLLQTRRAMIT